MMLFPLPSLSLPTSLSNLSILKEEQTQAYWNTHPIAWRHGTAGHFQDIHPLLRYRQESRFNLLLSLAVVPHKDKVSYVMVLGRQLISEINDMEVQWNVAIGFLQTACIMKCFSDVDQTCLSTLW